MDLYYHIRSLPCQSAAFLIKHMGLELNHKPTSIYDPKDLEELKRVNPQGTIPTLVDDGRAIWESHAILIYLAEKYALDDSLYPKDLAERTVVHQRLFFDNGLLQGAAMGNMLASLRKQPISAELSAKLKRGLELMEMFLTGSTYVAGEKLTIADFPVFASVASLSWMPYDLAPYPNVQRWCDRMATHIPDLHAMHKQAETDLRALLATVA
ncbi:glutathione S-transferase 1-like [Anopheles ziemanni]|uniref:glutathione S-transferase 1-like n=1 Tax=Anopheles coustani TaxID=139045 RepID=UPI00265956F9|nr:glutathione S-transferase 1-like [Anopheles coustani]XP_058174436.1 glutathione S-transferase 1-like [Anopheles ziemanni]